MTRKFASFVRFSRLNTIMKRTLLLIYFTIIFITSVSAQLYQYLDTNDGLSSRRVLSIQKDNKGYMWFLTHEGIDRYNGKQYVHYSLSADGQPNMKSFPNLNTLEIDTAGVIWEIGKNGYIFKYNSLQDKYELAYNFASKDKSNSGLPLISTYLDNKNNIWLCTKDKQYIFDIDQEKLIRLTSSIQEEITCITEAGNNQYFLGTNHNIFCVELIDKHQLQIQKHPQLDQFQIVTYLYFHKSTQTLIIGTLRDGIYLYNINTQQLMDVPTKLLDITVNTIIANPKKIDEVLIATNGAGVYKLNLFTRELSPFLIADHNHSNKMNGNIVNDIFIDKDDKLWMAIYPVGITLFSNKYPGYKWIQHSYDNPNSLIDNQVNSILEDSEGDIWYATSNGICFYNSQNKQWKCLLSTYQNDTQNQNHVFISMCETAPGTILVGGYMSGMYQINKKDMVPKYFSHQSTLGWTNIRPDKYIRCIYKDNDGIIWAGGYYNLKSYNIQTKEIQCYGMDFPVTCIKNKDQLFGTGNGAIEIADTVSLPNRFKSKMIFSDFSILYQKVFPGEKNSPLTQDIDDTEHITLDYNQNIFSLNVSSINYDNPSNILYTWKLEGFYDEWTSPTADNLIRYTNINPGHYKLRVRAILMDDEHVLEERAIKITITPPFWATFWAGIIYLIIIILITVSVLRFLWLRKDRNNSKEKIQFFINTAHDIRTPLTLIKAPLGEILKNEQLTEQGKININLAIQNTDNLSDLASNLINFEKEELYTPNVYVSRYELNSYIKSYIEQFKLYAEKKQIEIHFESNFTSQEVWLDRNKMDSIIRNLMTNALKYTQQGGSIKIQTSKSKSHWFLFITDTGIGISSNDQKKMFKELFRGKNATNLQITGSGIGMMLTYKLIKNHCGKISMSSIENMGTTFKLSFPIKSRKYNNKLFPKADVIDPLPIVREENKEEVTIPPIPQLKQADKEAPYILVAEDNVELRTFLLQILSDEYQVTGVSNGQEVINSIKTKQPDLILSDIMMPELNGEQMCRIVKNDVETSHIPVILLTALNDKESIIKGLQSKADRYIIKPFDVGVLKANITNVLAIRELIRKRYSQFQFTTEEENVPHPPLDLDQEFIIKVTETIKKNLSKELNVDTLCAAFNMSRSSFYNKIKALTNYSPSEFIRKVRMNEAAILLKSKKYTVSEVSDMLGFGDPKYFTDSFKKYFDVPPSVYMKQN